MAMSGKLGTGFIQVQTSMEFRGFWLSDFGGFSIDFGRFSAADTPKRSCSNLGLTLEKAPTSRQDVGYIPFLFHKMICKTLRTHLLRRPQTYGGNQNFEFPPSAIDYSYKLWFTEFKYPHYSKGKITVCNCGWCSAPYSSWPTVHRTNIKWKHFKP